MDPIQTLKVMNINNKTVWNFKELRDQVFQVDIIWFSVCAKIYSPFFVTVTILVAMHSTQSIVVTK